MKFICKDFWNSVFKKQVDNLRTNHQVIINYNVLLQFVNILSIIQSTLVTSNSKGLDKICPVISSSR